MQAIHTTLIAAAIAIGAACAPVHAGPDIFKCIDSDGRVTLTDNPCNTSAKSELVVSGPSEASATAAEPADGAAGLAVVAPTVERYTLPQSQVRRSWAPAKRLPVARGLARDVATLRAARLNLILLDNAADTLRAQRMAALQP